MRKVREVPDEIVLDLWEQLKDSTNTAIPKPIRIFCPKESADLLKDEVEGATVVACERLDDAVFLTWPELRAQ